MVKIFPAANSHDEKRCLVETSQLARSERSEACASRWAEFEPRVDVGGNRLSASSERRASQRALCGGRRASPRRTGSSHGRALRRWTLAWKLSGLSHDATRHPKVTKNCTGSWQFFP